MSDDLADRLRRCADDEFSDDREWVAEWNPQGLMREAADQLDRLDAAEAALERGEYLMAGNNVTGWAVSLSNYERWKALRDGGDDA